MTRFNSPKTLEATKRGESARHRLSPLRSIAHQRPPPVHDTRLSYYRFPSYSHHDISLLATPDSSKSPKHCAINEIAIAELLQSLQQLFPRAYPISFPAATTQALCPSSNTLDGRELALTSLRLRRLPQNHYLTFRTRLPVSRL